MTGVSQSALSITAIADVPTARRSLLRSNFKLKTGESAAIEYTTTAVLQSFGNQYSSVDQMISDLNNQVSTSFANPETATTWVQQSVTLGSTTITTSTSVVFGSPVVDPTKTTVVDVSTYSPTMSPTEDLSPNKNGDNNNNNKNKMIIIIIPVVIGGIILFLFGVGVGVFWRRKQDEMNLHLRPNSTNTNANFNPTISKSNLKDQVDSNRQVSHENPIQQQQKQFQSESPSAKEAMDRL